MWPDVRGRASALGASRPHGLGPEVELGRSILSLFKVWSPIILSFATLLPVLNGANWFCHQTFKGSFWSLGRFDKRSETV